MLEVDPWKDNFFFDLPSPFPPFPCVSSDQIAAQGDGGVDYEREGGGTVALTMAAYVLLSTPSTKLLSPK